jgi:CsoR family transcriptional regulator, copper-sensing transcriptional repressor
MSQKSPHLDEQITTTYLDPELVKSLQARLSRAAGHINAVKRMLDEEKECDQILIQMAAIKAAMNQVIIKTLEGHIAACVQPQATEEAGEEVLESLNRALKVVLKNS